MHYKQNAGWADQLGGECRDWLSEGSAEYFGRMYVFGEVDRVGIFDALEGILEPQQFLAYEVGAEAFDALVRWKGTKATTRFWENRASINCSSTFLSAFNVTAGAYERDWRDLTGG